MALLHVFFREIPISWFSEQENCNVFNEHVKSTGTATKGDGSITVEGVEQYIARLLEHDKDALLLKRGNFASPAMRPAPPRQHFAGILTTRRGFGALRDYYAEHGVGIFSFTPMSVEYLIKAKPSRANVLERVAGSVLLPVGAFGFLRDGRRYNRLADNLALKQFPLVYRLVRDYDTKYTQPSKTNDQLYRALDLLVCNQHWLERFTIPLARHSALRVREVAPTVRAGEPPTKRAAIRVVPATIAYDDSGSD